MKTTLTTAPPTDTGVCGTPAGRQRHQRRGQRVCEPCRVARLVEQRAHYAARAARLRGRALVTADDRRAALLALPLTSGRLSCTARRHLFTGPVGATLCVDCWGWRDDPRHPVVGGPVVGR
ncbi:hypothetical protein ACWD6N_03615 [Micromonospora sp. NPDC005163]